MNRKSQYAKAANDKVLGEMLMDGVDEDSMRFGKVTKMCGNSRVEVTLSDGRTANALIRNVLRGKQATAIRIGSVLLIGLPNWQKDAMAASEKPEAYVEAVLDRKTAKHFVALQRMPASFLVDGDAGSDEGEAAFEFGSDDEEDEKKPTAIAVAVAVAAGGAGKKLDEEDVGFRFDSDEDAEKPKEGNTVEDYTVFGDAAAAAADAMASAVKKWNGKRGKDSGV